jgi:four helix bundle protein
MKDFRDLQVWHKAHELALDVYRASSGFSQDERFGLTNQLRRAAVSIGANLAEGCGRGSDADFARFAQIAMGSASEAEYLVLLAHDLEELSEEDRDRLNGRISEVKRMLSALIKTLRAES